MDDLIGIHDVACFAMHAIGEVDLKFFLACACVFYHFINLGRAKVLAWVSVFLGASGAAKAGI